MKHGSLHTHSTLLQSTGNIERQRVRNEIKEFVKHDTERLQEELKENNLEFRKTLKQHHDHLLSLYEDNRKKQLERWRLRTMNSPLRLDQNEIQIKLNEEWKELFRRKRKENRLKEELRNMTGKPVFDICTNNYLNNITDPEKKLAMERRKLLLEKKIVFNETKKLKSMINHSLNDTEQMFPKIALQMAYGNAQVDQIMKNSNISKQKISGEEALMIKNQDNRVYSAAGRYDELGRFILVDDLKTKAGLVSAEYAQAVGKMGVTNEFQMVNSYQIEKQMSNSVINSTSYTKSSANSIQSFGSSYDNQRKIYTTDNILTKRNNYSNNSNNSNNSLLTNSYKTNVTSVEYENNSISTIDASLSIESLKL